MKRRYRNRMSIDALTDDVLSYANSSAYEKARQYVEWLVHSMNTDRNTISAAVRLLTNREAVK